MRINNNVLTPVIYALLTMGGCAIKRDRYDVPAAPLPAQYSQTVFPKADEVAPPLKDGKASELVPPEDGKASEVIFPEDSKEATKPQKEVVLDEWWRSLESAELNALIDQALANNADLRIAMLRVTQTQARSAQAHANEFPVITAPFEARHDDPPNGVNSALFPTTFSSRTYYQGSLRGDWQVDIWGELSAMNESAEMQMWRVTYQSDDTRRTLIANVASRYVEYLSLNDRIRVARETEIVLHGMLQAVSDRVEAGDATVIDLEQQRSADFAVQATIPGLELQREMAANALAQLLGVTPGMLALSDRGIDSLLFPGVLLDMPSSLLLRRPDVRAVEARLLAADADIDVARARLLPPLSLTSQAGAGLLSIAQLVQPYGIIYNALGNLSATIFDHGKRTQDVAYARSLHEELVETYVRVIYAAIRETEDGISNTHMNGRRLEAQTVATDAAFRAWKASQDSYGVGGIDFLTLIDTERTYHRTLDEYHRIRMERYQGLISLYSALGGGVPQGGVLPGEGDRPNACPGPCRKGDTTDVASVAATTAGIDWNASAYDEEVWLVELAGLQDRAGVTHAWRDLNQRFPALIADHVAIPRLQGRVAKEKLERATWYRLFIARFPSAEKASAFCGDLAAKLMRCSVVSSGDEEFSEFMDDEPPENLAVAANAKPVLHDYAQGKASSLVEGEASPTLPTQPSAVDADKAVVEPVGADLFAYTPFDRANQFTPTVPAAAAGASAPTGLKPRGYSIQLHSMSIRSNADNASAAWTRKGYETYIYPVLSTDGIVKFTVRTGVYTNRSKAVAKAVALRRHGQVDAFPVSISLDEGRRAQ